MKAEALVRDALQEIGKAAAQQPVTPDAFQTGCRYANNIGAEFAHLLPDWVDIDTANDDVVVPASANSWLVKILAERLGPQFAPEFDLTMIKLDRRDAYRNFLHNTREIIPADLPETLPIGSGNEWDESYRFYPSNADES